jgi:Cyclin
MVATMKGSSARLRSLPPEVCCGFLPFNVVDVSVRTVATLNCWYSANLLHGFVSRKTVYRIFINLKFEEFWDITLDKLVAITGVSQKVDTSIFRVVADTPGRSSTRCVNKSGVYSPRRFKELQNEML